MGHCGNRERRRLCGKRCYLLRQMPGNWEAPGAASERESGRTVAANMVVPGLPGSLGMRTWAARMIGSRP